MANTKSPFVLYLIGLAAGLVVLGIVLAIFVLPGYFTERSAVSAGDEMLMKIAQPWSGPAIQSVVDPKGPTPWPLDYCNTVAADFGYRFGSLKSVKGKIVSISTLRDFSGSYADAQYIGEAEFEKAKLCIGLNLIQRDGKWYLRMITENPISAP